MLKLDKIAHVRLLDLEIVFPHKKYNKEVSTPQSRCSNKALILCLCAIFSLKGKCSHSKFFWYGQWALWCVIKIERVTISETEWACWNRTGKWADKKNRECNGAMCQRAARVNSTNSAHVSFPFYSNSHYSAFFFFFFALVIITVLSFC